MSLSSISKVTITGNSRGVSQKGFGIPLIIGRHTHWPELFRSYAAATAVDTLISEGFTTYDPIVVSARSAASASPKVEKVIVGRLVTLFTHISTMEIKTAIVAGSTVAFTVRSPAGVDTEISYVVSDVDTPTTVATAVAALIDDISGITSAGDAAVITNTADSNNEMWRFIGYDLDHLDYADMTANSNLPTELGQIRQANSDWYGLILADCPSKARILALAAYVETIEAIYPATSFDTENANTSSEDSIQYALKAADYFRTGVIFLEDQAADPGAAWLGVMFPYAPGAATWAFKSLSGITVGNLSDTRVDALEVVNCNCYVPYHDVPITYKGKMASGEWIDIVVFRDWVVARIREGFASLLVNKPKIPFTNKGAGLVAAMVEGVMLEGVTAEGFDGEAGYTVTFPDVRTLDDSYKIGRLLPDIYFSATFSGAIHAAEFVGYLKV